MSELSPKAPKRDSVRLPGIVARSIARHFAWGNHYVLQRSDPETLQGSFLTIARTSVASVHGSKSRLIANL
jgi:hypothetical protein